MVVLGESGALRGLAFDLADDIGLDLLDLNDENSPALRAVLPDFVPVSNPTDITAIGLSEPVIYTNLLTALLEDERVGSVVASIIQSDPITSKIKFPAIQAALAGGDPGKPLVLAGVDEGANVPPEYIADLRAAGIPWFPSTERAYRAIARLADLAKRDLTDRSGEPLVVPGLADCSGVVPEYQAKALLAPLGIPFPQSTVRRQCGRSCRCCRCPRLSGGDEGAGRCAGPQERCGRGDPQSQVRRRCARGLHPHVRQCRRL